MGDLNQDGHEDIIVGVPRHSSLSDIGGAVAMLHKSQFGYSMANMGDLNQDGHEDIIVGVPRHSSLSDIGGAVAMLIWMKMHKSWM